MLDQGKVVLLIVHWDFSICSGLTFSLRSAQLGVATPEFRNRILSSLFYLNSLLVVQNCVIL